MHSSLLRVLVTSHAASASVHETRSNNAVYSIKFASECDVTLELYRINVLKLLLCIITYSTAEFKLHKCVQVHACSGMLKFRIRRVLFMLHAALMCAQMHVHTSGILQYTNMHVTSTPFVCTTCTSRMTRVYIELDSSNR